MPVIKAYDTHNLSSIYLHASIQKERLINIHIQKHGILGLSSGLNFYCKWKVYKEHKLYYPMIEHIHYSLTGPFDKSDRKDSFMAL